jgi:hypothetical protein
MIIIPIVYSTFLDRKEQRSDLIKSADNIIRKNRGLWLSPAQGSFFRMIIQKQKKVAPKKEHWPEIGSHLCPSDRAIIYHMFENKQSKVQIFVTMVIDDAGVRLKFLSSYSWTEKQAPAPKYDPRDHDAFARMREQAAGHRKQLLVLEYRSTSKVFEREQRL